MRFFIDQPTFLTARFAGIRTSTKWPPSGPAEGDEALITGTTGDTPAVNYSWYLIYDETTSKWERSKPEYMLAYFVGPNSLAASTPTAMGNLITLPALAGTFAVFATATAVNTSGGSQNATLEVRKNGAALLTTGAVAVGAQGGAELSIGTPDAPTTTGALAASDALQMWWTNTGAGVPFCDGAVFAVRLTNLT